MSKLLNVSLATIVSASVALAKTDPTNVGMPALPKGGKIIKMTKAELWEKQMKLYGGFIVDNRCQLGSIVLVNVNKAANTDWFNAPISEASQFAKFKWEIKDGVEFNPLKPNLQGALNLFVVDDPALPMSLMALEARWVMINVAPLKTEKSAFYEARVKKALTRGICYLLGAGDSQYPLCASGCITKPEDYDQIPDVQIPVDILGKFPKYAKGYGVTPSKKVTYKAAVRGGWAPAPTNEYQQAIWDKVHELPTKPIKILPETKKVKD